MHRLDRGATADEGSRRREHRRLRCRPAARRRPRRRARHRMGPRRARTAHRRLRRHPDPLARPRSTPTCWPRPTGCASSRRAGVGVDNVDVDAATRRGVVVANAPQSNVITAAEHTMALLLALARNVPQAHASLIGGAWDRAKFTGVELHEKTLGIVGFGRIGQLVAHRARGFGMRVIAFDVYLAEERFAELGVERAADARRASTRSPISSPSTCRRTRRPKAGLNAAAFAKMKDGVRILNVARGPLIVDEDLQAALDSGKVAGAALDVFRTEPVTDHPLFGYPNVDRHAAPRCVHRRGDRPRRLPGGRAGRRGAHRRRGDQRGQPARDRAGRPRGGRAVPGPGRDARADRRRARARERPIDGVEVEYLGRIAERDTRLLTIQIVKGLLSRAHRRGRQRRQRDHPRAGARHRDRRDEQPAGARLHRPRARAAAQRRRGRPASSARCSAGATGRTCSRRGVRGSTCSSRGISRCSATATSPACSAASAPRSAMPA